MSTAGLLADMEARMHDGSAGLDRAVLLHAADELLQESHAETVLEASESGMRLCQKLYNQARSLDALPIALSVFQRATDLGDTKLTYRAAFAAGLLSSDTADFAGAIEFHGRALEIMNGMGDDAGAGRVWNNIGSALCGVGRYELASAGFKQTLYKFESVQGPQLARYAALGNLAQCALHLGTLEEGLESAALAFKELQQGTNIFCVEAISELLLRRNTIRLLVATGDLAGAEEQIKAAKILAKQDGGIRASIAVATAQAVIDIARGQFDIAGTRLEKCLSSSRSSRPALRDTLACMVRADESIGNPARALIRLQELSDLMHDAGEEAAKAHIALTDWRRSIHAFSLPPELVQTRARLERKRSTASVPSIWPTLTRIALGNSMQIDPSAAHGARVGALSRLLAQSCSLSPLQALEIGLAAQVHDVGIAADQENLIGHRGNPMDGYGAEEDLAHCEAGWRILCEDDHPRILLAREIAKYHHSWVDGGGYPGGLTGRAIPLHARICAVADAYDNIMHAGRTAGEDTIATGLLRLRSLSGSRLDPELVELFVETLEDETRNEGIELESGHGLTSFHQLITSLSSPQRYL